MKTLAQLIAETALEGEAYFTVVLPPGKTEWQHATKTLTRGAYATEAEAHAWAKKNVPGVKYSVKRIEGVVEGRVEESSSPAASEVLAKEIEALNEAREQFSAAAREVQRILPALKDAASYTEKFMADSRKTLLAFMDAHTRLEILCEKKLGQRITVKPLNFVPRLYSLANGKPDAAVKLATEEEANFTNGVKAVRQEVSRFATSLDDVRIQFVEAETRLDKAHGLLAKLGISLEMGSLVGGLRD
jgi:multidrug efflux pump subunit AcrB